jgi:asparagine synthase (glutamine-hydrolysing)
VCGIAGFIQTGNLVWDFTHLKKAGKTLQHRGPDGIGFCGWSENEEIITTLSKENIESNRINVGFMHRRLAIIDPYPEGNQPFFSKDRKVALVWNGEIYNYLILKKELEGFGFSFSTKSDSEVLLAAYQKWGKKVLSKLDGMWAMAILDLDKNLFFAATDRVGIKPFYYSIQDQKICFSSEIKALFDFGIPAKGNEKAISRFLIHGLSDESEETFFQNIFRLKGGEALEFHLKTSEMKRYSWHSFSPNPGFDFQTYNSENKRIEEIRSLLVEMIGLRLQTDVPLGICLSGGIDSSTIAGLVAFAEKTKSGPSRKAFMASLSSGNEQDESGFAKLVASQTGFEFTATSSTEFQFTEDFEDLIFTLDEPPPGLNAYSQFAVFKTVSENGIKVSLDGQGADEIFGGYPRHVLAWMNENLKHGQLPSGFERYWPLWGKEWTKKFLFQNLQKSRNINLKPEYQIFTKETFALGGPPRQMEKNVNHQLFKDFTSQTLPFLLKAADRNSMRWSVESRMPFADFSPLVNLMFSIPGNAKMSDGFSKNLLRKAAKAFVPEPILSRKDKIGFAAPNQIWLSHLLKNKWENRPSAFLEKDILEKFARKYLEKPQTIDYQIIWRALAFLEWERQFLKTKL